MGERERDGMAMRPYGASDGELETAQQPPHQHAGLPYPRALHLLYILVQGAAQRQLHLRDRPQGRRSWRDADAFLFLKVHGHVTGYEPGCEVDAVKSTHNS